MLHWEASQEGSQFRSRVIPLDIGKTDDEKETVLIQVVFDDGDKEDYEPHNWESQLVIDNESTLSYGKYHPYGAVVWKKFDLEGEVTGGLTGE